MTMTKEQLEKGLSLQDKIQEVKDNLHTMTNRGVSFTGNRCGGPPHDDLAKIGEDVRQYAIKKLKVYEAKLQKEFKAI